MLSHTFHLEIPTALSERGCNSKTMSMLRLCETDYFKILQHHCVFSIFMSHFIPTLCHSTIEKPIHPTYVFVGAVPSNRCLIVSTH